MHRLTSGARTAVRRTVPGAVGCAGRTEKLSDCGPCSVLPHACGLDDVLALRSRPAGRPALGRRALHGWVAAATPYTQRSGTPRGRRALNEWVAETTPYPHTLKEPQLCRTKSPGEMEMRGREASAAHRVPVDPLHAGGACRRQHKQTPRHWPQELGSRPPWLTL